MRVTIEPTEDQSHIRNVDCLYNKVSIEIPSDELTVREAMEQAVKALQAWGFHNENIASYLDEEFAQHLGLTVGKPHGSTWVEADLKDKDKTLECGGV